MLLRLVAANEEEIQYIFVDDPKHDGPGWYYGESTPWLVVAGIMASLCAEYESSGALFESTSRRDELEERLAQYGDIEWAFLEDGHSVSGGNICVFSAVKAMLMPWTRAGLEAAAFALDSDRAVVVHRMFEELSRYRASGNAFSVESFSSYCDAHVIARVSTDYETLLISLGKEADLERTLRGVQRAVTNWNQGLSPATR